MFHALEHISVLRDMMWGGGVFVLGWGGGGVGGMFPFVALARISMLRNIMFLALEHMSVLRNMMFLALEHISVLRNTVIKFTTFP